MKKAKRLFAFLAFISVMIFLTGQASSLFSQTAKGEQAQEVDLNASEQEKAEAQAQKELDKLAEAEKAQYEIVVKTYSLKYISASEFVNAARFYIVDSTGSENALTVKILKKNIPALEDLLKKLDVEKKIILFQVYTIIASKEQFPEKTSQQAATKENEEIENRDLKRVLDELKSLWNFKYYKVDSPSFLTVKEKSGSNYFKLVSNMYDFDMIILHVNVHGDEPGKRVVSVGQLQLAQTVRSPDQYNKFTLIDTHDITLKEKGYLVAGVSGFSSGWRGQALILVISVEIK